MKQIDDNLTSELPVLPSSQSISYGIEADAAKAFTEISRMAEEAIIYFGCCLVTYRRKKGQRIRRAKEKNFLTTRRES